MPNIWAYSSLKILNGPSMCLRYHRGNATLGFLRHNLKNAPTQLKETAFLAVVRLVLEYGVSKWDAYKLKDINRLERVQHKAVLFVKNHHCYTCSVREMLTDLGWKSLTH